MLHHNLLGELHLLCAPSELSSTLVGVYSELTLSKVGWGCALHLVCSSGPLPLGRLLSGITAVIGCNPFLFL